MTRAAAEGAYGGYAGTVRALRVVSGQGTYVASSNTVTAEPPRFMLFDTTNYWQQQVYVGGGVVDVALFGLWHQGAEVRAVGNSGAILARASNGSWNVEGTPANAKVQLRGIDGRNVNDLWAVGEGGVILHRTNAGWSLAPLVARQGLAAVVVDQLTGQAWAVGAGGTILHYNP